MENTQTRDEQLWRIAKKRAEFKRHLLSYFTVNLFVWLIWLWGGLKDGHYGFIWPIFVTLGWGIGLGFNFYDAYFGFDRIEKEYQKLINTHV